jgi:TonB family protein
MPDEKAPNPAPTNDGATPVAENKPTESGASEHQKTASRGDSRWWWYRLSTDGKVATIIGILAVIVSIAVPGVTELLHLQKEAAARNKSEPPKSGEPNKDSTKTPSPAAPLVLPPLVNTGPVDYYSPKVSYPPILLKRVEPIYPALALKKKMQGDVEVDIDIGENGSVDHVRAWMGDPILIEAATTAVKKWKYNPYIEDGKPEKVSTSATIKFRLPKKSQ